MSSETIILQPIGRVSSPVTDISFTDWADIVSRITVDDAWAPGLEGLGEYSHIVVVFYLDNAHFDPVRDMVRHPKDRIEAPLAGVFATRSQYRPNPIAVSTVRLLQIADNVLTVEGLDALDGTPVLDIKPYSPDQELIAHATSWPR